MTDTNRPRHHAAALLLALVARQDPKPILAAIRPPEYAEVAKAQARWQFDQVKFHSKAFIANRDHWRSIPAPMMPLVRSYLEHRP